MSFSSPVFLFYFFPIFTVAYFISPKKIRPFIFIIASLFYYFWGETHYFSLLLLWILFNYLIGRGFQKAPENEKNSTRWLAIGLFTNIGILFFFKLYTTYSFNFQDFPHITISYLDHKSAGVTPYLPLGISFFTFSAISYIIDVYKGRTESETNIARFTSFLLMFPKITAGPITRYREIHQQLDCTIGDTSSIANGLRRFVIGLSKKVLIANGVASLSDRIFALPGDQLTFGIAWLGVISYTIQLYYDFSGYSDMAIGIGQMLGFKFPENFNYPYVSKSISEFWRRWHISLSNWFRDYVFFPLERKRRGKEGAAQYLNILIVFLLTGLWHGVTINFILWGLIHGVSISLETSKAGSFLRKLWGPLQHGYALLIILGGWVFFRTKNVIDAAHFFKAMAGFSKANGLLLFGQFPPIDHQTWLALLLGILFAFPIIPVINNYRDRLTAKPVQMIILNYGMDFVLICLLFASLVVMISSTFRPYLYANF